MYFLIDEQNKIIFGWSAKCGCSLIKKIFWFLINGNENNQIHTDKDYNNLPDDITNYTTILIIRNPYERIISGFLDKYNSERGPLRKLWKHDDITFSTFVDELIKNDWIMIDKHHFTQQTTEFFDKNKILKSKSLKIYDIKNIDYKYIETLYNKKISEYVLNYKMGHERQKYNDTFDINVFDLDMDIYYNYNVPIKNFYNQEIKNKVYEFYKNDFLFFKEYGFNYDVII
jgi:hypothetical protein